MAKKKTPQPPARAGGKKGRTPQPPVPAPPLPQYAPGAGAGAYNVGFTPSVQSQLTQPYLDVMAGTAYGNMPNVAGNLGGQQDWAGLYGGMGGQQFGRFMQGAPQEQGLTTQMGGQAGGTLGAYGQVMNPNLPLIANLQGQLADIQAGRDTGFDPYMTQQYNQSEQQLHDTLRKQLGPDQRAQSVQSGEADGVWVSAVPAPAANPRRAPASAAEPCWAGRRVRQYLWWPARPAIRPSRCLGAAVRTVRERHLQHDDGTRPRRVEWTGPVLWQSSGADRAHVPSADDDGPIRWRDGRTGPRSRRCTTAVSAGSDGAVPGIDLSDAGAIHGRDDGPVRQPLGEYRRGHDGRLRSRLKCRHESGRGLDGWRTGPVGWRVRLSRSDARTGTLAA